ncbi:hypothetical protein BS78_05G250800 [Paspalum vaginatum]|nr:hypothetical protein BS78_05G250800 [Paspalum vaginatum]
MMESMLKSLCPRPFTGVEVQWKPPQKWLVSRNCANYYLARNFVMWSYQHCFVDYRQEQSSDFNLSVTSLTKAAEQILPVNIYHVYLNEKELQQPWPPPIHKQLVSSGAEVPPTLGMFSYFIQGSALQVSPRSPPLCKVLYCPACVHPSGQMSTDLVALGCSKMSAFLQYYKDRDNWFCASDVISVIQFSLSNPTNMSCDTTDSRESILIIELHLAWDPGNGATMVNGHASMRKTVHSNGPFLLAVSKSEKLKVALVDLQNINSTHQRPDNQFLVLEFSCSKENVGLLHLPQWSSPVSWHYMSLFPGSNQMIYKVLDIFPELGEHYCNTHERSIHEGQGFLNQLQISLSKFTARCGATQLKHVQAAAPRELEQFWRQAVCLLIVQDEFLSDFTDQEVKYTYCSPMLFTLPEHLTIDWYYLSAVVQQAFQSLAVFQIALIIAELEAPWDPGDSMSVNNGLGASRVLRRGECQDTSQSRASSCPSPVNPAPSAAGPAPDEAVAAHLQLDDAAAAVAPDLPPKEAAAAHLSAVAASAPPTCRPTRP